MRRLQRPALRSGQPPAVWARLRRGGALLLVALAALAAVIHRARRRLLLGCRGGDTALPGAKPHNEENQ